MTTRLRADSLLDSDDDVPLGSTTPALEPTRAQPPPPPFYATGENRSFSVPHADSTDFALEGDDDNDDDEDDDDDQRSEGQIVINGELDTEDPLELYIPGLTSQTLFGQLPLVRPSVRALSG